jgi:galactose-1-phosphate uridylyltransferase
LVRLPDGTVKQHSPLTGTVVWTVPGRAQRPVPRHTERSPGPCAFCPEHYLQTPPEKSRVVVGPDRWHIPRNLPVEALDDTVAEFRRIPNLYEILSVDYWRANHGYRVPPAVQERAEAYTSTPAGREHVLAILRKRLGDDVGLDRAVDLFAGTHDVVVARRHESGTELAGSGTLTPDEHHQYLAFTVDTMRELYEAQPHARYVAAFQNWLRPAGASFDHLHKQLVAIDEYGPRIDQVLRHVAGHPRVFNDLVDHAADHGLVVARNDGAIASAGVGHRYPALEVYSTSENHLPWDHTPDEVRGLSDLLHALHAATGTTVPTNEEWHHRPATASGALPWHVVLKWRVSTLAGFEGGTKINVNTLDPSSLRDRVVTSLLRLREEGHIGPMAVGDECRHRPGILRY